MQFPNNDEDEIGGEYNFNNCIRNGISPLLRTMSIPIPTNYEKQAWCSVTMYLYLSKSKGLQIYDVWNKLINHVQDRIGYVRSGARKHSRTSIIIITSMDIFGDVQLNELKASLEELTQCRVHIDHVVTIN